MPEGPFDIICSRYAICLYLKNEAKAEALAAMVQRLRPGGFLVIGRKDRLPEGFLKSAGLTHVPYRAEDEFCPYGPEELLEEIFRKDVDPATVSSSSLASTLESEDPRFKASTYVEYLRSINQVPDWTADRERVWTDLVTQKMTAKSRRLLEKACLEGRRTDTEGSLVDRMANDLEGRKERQRAREAQKLSEVEAESLLGTQQHALTKEEASTKVQSFFDRLQKDSAHRVAVVQDRSEEPPAPGHHKKRRQSRKRASTATLLRATSAGFPSISAGKPKRGSSGRPALVSQDFKGTDTEFRGRGQRKSSTH